MARNSSKISLITVWIISVGIALLFGYAGILKIIAPEAFLADILNYQITGYKLSWLTALWLPWLEVVAALTLLLPKWRQAAAILLTVLMLIFTIAIISAWARGLDINCGCFGGSESTNYSTATIRDLLILSALSILLYLNKQETKTRIKVSLKL